MMTYHARELTVREKARGSAVRAYPSRPGLVATPLANQDIPPMVQKLMCLTLGYKPCPIPAAAGADTPTYLSVAQLPESAEGEMFFFCDRVPPPAGWTAANQVELFDLSLNWTHASY